LFAGAALTGCDDSPTSVDDFDIQPNVSVSTSSLSLVISGAESSVDFDVQYQGLSTHPTAEGSGVLSLTKSAENGEPSNGSQTWSVGVSESVSGIVEETVVVRSPTGDREIVDSLTVSVAPFVVTSDFSSRFAVIADYEDAQRDSVASGGTTFEIVNDVASGSNGIRAMQVNASGSGAVTFERRASAPNADRFTFLVKPNPNTDFNLTLTFTEEASGAETEHEFTVPVNAGSQWLKYGIVFSQIGADFNPVATRAGGNGPLLSVSLSADQAVTYHVDQLMLGDANGAQVEIDDLERTSTAYGPPFCDPTFGESGDVAAVSDGFTARTVQGTGCFGYNYSSDGSDLFVDVSGSDVVSFLANGTPGDSIFVFVETPEGDAGRPGGFTFDNGIQVGLPQTGSWARVEVPLDSLGDAPAVLNSAGISNVGFVARGEDPDFAIDDIKIGPSEN
jgi:hypothetical protein